MSHTKSLFYANKVNDPHKRDRFKACIDTVGETLKLNTLIGVYSPMLGTEYAASKSDNNIVVYMSDFIAFFFVGKKSSSNYLIVIKRTGGFAASRWLGVTLADWAALGDTGTFLTIRNTQLRETRALLLSQESCWSIDRLHAGTELCS